MTDRLAARGVHDRSLPFKNGLLGVQTPIICLAILELYAEASAGFLLGVGVLLYGSYLVGRNRDGPVVGN